MKGKRRTVGHSVGVVLGIGLSGALVPQPGAALTVNINAGAGLVGNAAALTAFHRAGDQWESIFSDPITVNINADLTATGFNNPNIIGQARSTLGIAAYDPIRNQMVLDAADEADDTIVASLPRFSQLNALVPAGFTINDKLVATSANLKAMGFAFNVSADANITFNSAFSFDFDNGNGVGVGQMDFQTVAAHEIGHALGFVSSVDFVDQNASGRIDVRALDLFRFDPATAPANAAQFTTAPRDLTPGGTSLFSDTVLQVLFSTGVAKGDGNQASHWKDNQGLGIMDPTLARGELSPIRASDIRALDVIGWDAVAVPLPGALLPFASALCGFAAFGRRRQVARV